MAIIQQVDGEGRPGSAARLLKLAVDTPLLERYFWMRNFCLILGSAVGLVAAQVVWVLDHLDKSRSAP